MKQSYVTVFLGNYKQIKTRLAHYNAQTLILSDVI